jgi:hypothetical protein
LNELRERIDRFQTTTGRLEERIAALEGAVRAQEIRLSANVPGPQVRAPKDLPVVKMEAPGQSGGPPDEPVAAESDEQRTLIVGEGNRVEARPTTDSNAEPTRKAKEKAPASRSPSKGQTNATVSGNKAP